MARYGPDDLHGLPRYHLEFTPGYSPDTRGVWNELPTTDVGPDEIVPMVLEPSTITATGRNPGLP